MKYSPDMDDIVLPVYTPVNYKPGFSGNRGRADQKKDKHNFFAWNSITDLIEMWEELGGLRVDCKGVEEEVGGSSSRRVSQEFKNIFNIFEQNSQPISPTGRLSFSSISTNGRVWSLRKIKRIASLHTQFLQD